MKLTINDITVEGTVEECYEFHSKVTNIVAVNDNSISLVQEIAAESTRSHHNSLEAAETNYSYTERKLRHWYHSDSFYALVDQYYTETHNVREVERKLRDHYVYAPSYPTLLKITRDLKVCPRR